MDSHVEMWLDKGCDLMVLDWGGDSVRPVCSDSSWPSPGYEARPLWNEGHQGKREKGESGLSKFYGLLWGQGLKFLWSSLGKVSMTHFRGGGGAGNRGAEYGQRDLGSKAASEAFQCLLVQNTDIPQRYNGFSSRPPQSEYHNKASHTHFWVI